MKYAILDTNFILTCVKQKIDFFEDIKLMGFQIVIPKQVINEIEKIPKSKKKRARFAKEYMKGPNALTVNPKNQQKDSREG